jgi:hypothetical protein
MLDCSASLVPEVNPRSNDACQVNSIACAPLNGGSFAERIPAPFPPFAAKSVTVRPL